MSRDAMFRQIGEPLPPGRKPGTCWQVEYYGYTDDALFPDAIAWVVTGDTESARSGAHARIEYVLVDDDLRRKGIATRLVKLIMKRWPGAELAPPVGRPGKCLHRKFATSKPRGSKNG